MTAFVVLAFLLSWLAWLPLLAAVQGWVDMRPRPGLHLVGALGPALAAVLVVGLTEGLPGLSRLARRLCAWRGRRRAWTFAVLVPPALLLVAAPLSALIEGGSPFDPDWSAFGRSAEFASLPLGLWWLANLGFYGVGEEVGWRGFLQPRLEMRHSVVTSAGLVSLPWAAWHLPLFGITPGYRAMPLVGLVGFGVSIWVASWIFAWLLHAGRGSLMIVAFFHAWFDIVTTSPLGPVALPTAMGVGITLVGLVLLRRLLRLPKVRPSGPTSHRSPTDFPAPKDADRAAWVVPRVGTTHQEDPVPTDPQTDIRLGPASGDRTSSSVDVLLADGRVATIRTVTTSDHDAMVALHARASDDSIRFRFFAVSRVGATAYAERLTSPSGEPVPSLVAVLGDDVVGVASAERVDPTTAEVAFLVADEAHGLGLGTLLLEHLAADARAHGITSFVAEVLSDNVGMLRVFTDAGFDVHRRSAGGVVTLRLSTAATAAAVAAADRRECAAEARSLAPLLAPRSIAVSGVRRDGTGVGGAVLRRIRDGGFAGDVYVVHPGVEAIGGTPAFADFGAIGHPVDVAMIVVPADRVVAAVRQAAEAGARVAVVITAGFGELGAEGLARQQEMVEVARHHSMRLVGPNCLGVIANDPDIRLNATFTRESPPAGGLAVASQSGGVGIALLDMARDSGLGIASFVSLGNKADVSGNDLLAAWMNDDRVAAAALYLESFGNAQKFARLARSFSERKPLLAMVGGSSSGGRRAGASHTAAAAAPSVGVDALFAQAGVIQCRSIPTLADTARLLTTQPLPAGPRLGIVGNAGGLGVLAADAATRDGLVVPELSARARAGLGTQVQGAAALSNPVDLGAGAGAAGFLASLRSMLECDEVDAVLAVVAATAVTDADTLLETLVRERTRETVKPVLLVALGGIISPPDSAAAFTRFRSVEDATEALAHAVRYGAWLAAPRGAGRPQAPGVAGQARALATTGLASPGTSAEGWLAYPEARSLLACYGIDAPTGTLTTEPEEAVAAAVALGFPVVAKVADPNVVHRTERGLVRTGLTSGAEVRRAIDAFRGEVGPRVPVLIQPQVGHGVEIGIGVVRDPHFGPLVMVAAGGVATDVWADRVFLMPPITDADAARVLRTLRIWALLAGHRGSAPVDVVAVEQLILAVAELALDVPALVELDLNPVIVTATGVHCVDAKMRLAAPLVSHDAGVPRRLRAAGTPR